MMGKRHAIVALVFFIVIMGKVSGLFKDLMFTYYYGVSDITDGYFLANSMSSLVYIALYATVPVLVVPLYSRLLTKGNQEATDSSLTVSLFFLCLVSVLLAVVVGVFSSRLIELITGGASEHVKALASDYLRIMAATFVLSTAVGFFNALQTVKKFSLPSYVVPLVNNMVFCTGLVLFSPEEGLSQVLWLGVGGWGVLLVSNILLSKGYFSLSTSGAWHRLKEISLLVVVMPALLAFFIEQVNGFVGVYFASSLEAGAISVLGYAGKLNLLFISIFLVFLTAKLFPRIAALVTIDSADELGAYLTRCVRIIVLVSLPVISYMIFYSQSIVELLFKRGKFLEEDVSQVSSVLSILLIAVPLGLIRDLMNRFFFARGRNVAPMLLSLLALIVNFIISFYIHADFGLKGLAAAMVVSTLICCCASLHLVARDIGVRLMKNNFWVLLVAALSLSVSFSFLILLNNTLSTYWIVLFFPFSCCYIAVLYLFQVEECVNAVTWIKRRCVL